MSFMDPFASDQQLGDNNQIPPLMEVHDQTEEPVSPHMDDHAGSDQGEFDDYSTDQGEFDDMEDEFSDGSSESAGVAQHKFRSLDSEHCEPDIFPDLIEKFSKIYKPLMRSYRMGEYELEEIKDPNEVCDVNPFQHIIDQMNEEDEEVLMSQENQQIDVSKNVEDQDVFSESEEELESSQGAQGQDATEAQDVEAMDAAEAQDVEAMDADEAGNQGGQEKEVEMQDAEPAQHSAEDAGAVQSAEATGDAMVQQADSAAASGVVDTEPLQKTEIAETEPLQKTEAAETEPLQKAEAAETEPLQKEAVETEPLQKEAVETEVTELPETTAVEAHTDEELYKDDSETHEDNVHIMDIDEDVTGAESVYDAAAQENDSEANHMSLDDVSDDETGMDKTHVETDPLKVDMGEEPDAFWYYRGDRKGALHGPMTTEAVQKLLDDGELNLEGLVWREEFEDFTAISKLFKRKERKCAEVEKAPASTQPDVSSLAPPEQPDVSSLAPPEQMQDAPKTQDPVPQVSRGVLESENSKEFREQHHADRNSTCSLQGARLERIEEREKLLQVLHSDKTSLQKQIENRNEAIHFHERIQRRDKEHEAIYLDNTVRVQEGRECLTNKDAFKRDAQSRILVDTMLPEPLQIENADQAPNKILTSRSDDAQTSITEEETPPVLPPHNYELKFHQASSSVELDRETNSTNADITVSPSCKRMREDSPEERGDSPEERPRKRARLDDSSVMVQLDPDRPANNLPQKRELEDPTLPAGKRQRLQFNQSPHSHTADDQRSMCNHAGLAVGQDVDAWVPPSGDWKPSAPNGNMTAAMDALGDLEEPLQKRNDDGVDYDGITETFVFLKYPPGAIKGRLDITVNDIGRLRPGAYLNDTLVDFYLKYLFLEGLPEEVRDRSHMFNQFFYTKLLQSQHDAKRRKKSMKRWTKKMDLFSKDYVIIPINENNHWSLVVVENPSGCFLELKEQQEREQELDRIAQEQIEKLEEEKKAKQEEENRQQQSNTIDIDGPEDFEAGGPPETQDSMMGHTTAPGFAPANSPPRLGGQVEQVGRREARDGDLLQSKTTPVSVGVNALPAHAFPAQREDLTEMDDICVTNSQPSKRSYDDLAEGNSSHVTFSYEGVQSPQLKFRKRMTFSYEGVQSPQLKFRKRKDLKRVSFLLNGKQVHVEAIKISPNAAAADQSVFDFDNDGHYSSEPPVRPVRHVRKRKTPVRATVHDPDYEEYEDPYKGKRIGGGDPNAVPQKFVSLERRDSPDHRAQETPFSSQVSFNGSDPPIEPEPPGLSSGDPSPAQTPVKQSVLSNTIDLSQDPDTPPESPHNSFEPPSSNFQFQGASQSRPAFPAPTFGSTLLVKPPTFSNQFSKPPTFNSQSVKPPTFSSQSVQPPTFNSQSVKPPTFSQPTFALSQPPPAQRVEKADPPPLQQVEKAYPPPLQRVEKADPPPMQVDAPLLQEIPVLDPVETQVVDVDPPPVEPVQTSQQSVEPVHDSQESVEPVHASQESVEQQSESPQIIENMHTDSARAGQDAEYLDGEIEMMDAEEPPPGEYMDHQDYDDEYGDGYSDRSYDDEYKGNNWRGDQYDDHDLGYRDDSDFGNEEHYGQEREEEPLKSFTEEDKQWYLQMAFAYPDNKMTVQMCKYRLTEKFDGRLNDEDHDRLDEVLDHLDDMYSVKENEQEEINSYLDSVLENYIQFETSCELIGDQINGNYVWIGFVDDIFPVYKHASKPLYLILHQAGYRIYSKGYSGKLVARCTVPECNPIDIEGECWVFVDKEGKEQKFTAAINPVDLENMIAACQTKAGFQKAVESKTKILHFDSMRGCHTSGRIFNLVRKYLSDEWERKRNESFVLNELSCPGVAVSCPQQENSYDCGVYLLHNCEFFLNNPIQDIGLSIDRRDWFSLGNKRNKIEQLIIQKRREAGETDVNVGRVLRTLGITVDQQRGLMTHHRRSVTPPPREPAEPPKQKLSLEDEKAEALFNEFQGFEGLELVKKIMHRLSAIDKSAIEKILHRL